MVVAKTTSPLDATWLFSKRKACAKGGAAVDGIAMSDIEIRKEVDVVSFDLLFIERQRNRYASRAVAYVVWLNGLAAIGLLIASLTRARLIK